MIKKVIIIIVILNFCSVIEVFGVRQVEYLGRNYRDPLKPLLPKIPPESKIRSLNLDVQGIIWDTDRPTAIINGTVLNVGDTIAGVEIIKISKEGILISYLGETFLIKSGRTEKGE